MDITSGETKMSILVNFSKGTEKEAVSGKGKTARNFKDSIKLISETDMECTDGRMAMSTKDSLGTTIGMALARWVGQMAKSTWENGRTGFSMAKGRLELAFLPAICNLNCSFSTESPHQTQTTKSRRLRQKQAQAINSHQRIYSKQTNSKKDYQWTRAKHSSPKQK